VSGFDDENPDDASSGIPDRLKRWWGTAKDRLRLGRLTSRVKEGAGGVRRFEFKKIELKKVSENSHRIRWGLIVLGIFLLADITARIIGMFIRPTYTSLPRKQTQTAQRYAPSADYDSILRRNMFNVEQKIPQPFDQGQLDCLSQAKASTQRILLLGTIVMNDETHSVALLQEEGSATKIAVKKDETFMDGRYQAKKVDRKKLCFQVKASGDFEFIEIPDDSLNLGMGASLTSDVKGIAPMGENKYAVERTYLDASLKNLPDIVNSARAIPYNDPNTGKFGGFLIQSIDPTSPFAALGMQRGDILTFVNDIVLDNPGRGIEAFNRLKQAPKISLGIIRNGSKTTLDYEVK